MQPETDADGPGSADQDSVTPEAVRGTAAHAIAEHLTPMIRQAEAAGLDMLAYLLGMAKIEAEEIASKPATR